MKHPKGVGKVTFLKFSGYQQGVWLSQESFNRPSQKIPVETKLSLHRREGLFFLRIGSWLMGNKSRCLEQFLGWDHSISGKTWERSLTVNKDSDRRTLQYYIASLWHLGGNISRSIVLYSISFIISEISATGCCHSHWTKWPLTWQSCPSEPMWKHGLFYL